MFTGQASDESSLELCVTDDGPGIPEEMRVHIFDPFYSGRNAGRGLGMGLPKAWRIAQLHGGKVSVDSARRGTTVTIHLPAAPTEDQDERVCA